MVLCDITSAIFQFPPHKYISLSYLCHSSVFVVDVGFRHDFEHWNEHLSNIFNPKKQKKAITTTTHAYQWILRQFGWNACIYDLYTSLRALYNVHLYIACWFGLDTSKCIQMKQPALKFDNDLLWTHSRTSPIFHSYFALISIYEISAFDCNNSPPHCEHWTDTHFLYFKWQKNAQKKIATRKSIRCWKFHSNVVMAHNCVVTVSISMQIVTI